MKAIQSAKRPATRSGGALTSSVTGIINLAGNFQAEESKRETAAGLNLLIEARRTQVTCMQEEVEKLIQLRSDALLAFTDQLDIGGGVGGLGGERGERGGAGGGPQGRAGRPARNMEFNDQLLSLYQDSIVVSDYQHKRYLSVFQSLSPDPDGAATGQQQGSAEEADRILDVSTWKLIYGLTQRAHARVPGGAGSVLQVILIDVAKMLGAERAVVYWVHPDPARQALIAYTSDGGAYTVHGRKVRHKGIAGHVIRSGEPVQMLADVPQHKHYVKAVDGFSRGDGEVVQSLVAEPMRSTANGQGSVVCGCIVVQDFIETTGGNLVPMHRVATLALAALASHLSCALQNARIDEEICLLE
jgi:hypothetical protein